MSYKYTRKRKSVYAEINIVPFLNVLLVLLLIFMATAPVINQSVEVDLPESSQSKIVNEDRSSQIILEVAGVDMYTLSIDEHKYNNISKEEIIEKTAEEYAKNNKALFLVGGSKDVPYEEVIKAIDLLHEAGIKQVGLMTAAK